MESVNFIQQLKDDIHLMYKEGKKYNCRKISITSDMINGINNQNVVETNLSSIDTNEIISDRYIDLTTPDKIMDFIRRNS